MIAAAVLAFCLSAAAQTQDLSAKAEADIAKLVGEWTFTMDNPLGGAELKGVVTFVKDEKGVHFEMPAAEYGKLVSDPLKAEKNGKITTVYTVVEYDVDVLCTITLKSDDAGVIDMEASGMVMNAPIQRKK